MKTEFIITLFFAILSNIFLGYLIFTIQELPFWATYLITTLYNVAIGMVIMNYMYGGVN